MTLRISKSTYRQPAHKRAHHRFPLRNAIKFVTQIAALCSMALCRKIYFQFVFSVQLILDVTGEDEECVGKCSYRPDFPQCELYALGDLQNTTICKFKFCHFLMPIRELFRQSAIFGWYKYAQFAVLLMPCEFTVYISFLLLCSPHLCLNIKAIWPDTDI